MTIPPLRNLPLFVISCTVLGWVLAALVDLCRHAGDLLPPRFPSLARRKALGPGDHWPRTGKHRQKRRWCRGLVW